ncbi:hypothetical protein P4C99_18085 [Pontiellaceae bacterium B1224]|nr:hypothetical protein [Pontiellaceae bacterium B1224]
MPAKSSTILHTTDRFYSRLAQPETVASRQLKGNTGKFNCWMHRIPLTRVTGNTSAKIKPHHPLIKPRGEMEEIEHRGKYNTKAA